MTRRAVNVLFITADDLGLYLGCYGEKRIATPNLDKFAASGVQSVAAGNVHGVDAACQRAVWVGEWRIQTA